MSKYIDADALKRKFRYSEADTEDERIWTATMRRMIDETPAADVEPVRKWILCEERMPKIDEDVLTCNESGFITISSCNGGGEFSSFADEYYIGHRDKKPKVVAWMPLPEPPKKMDGGSV